MTDPQLTIKYLGRQPYEPVWRAMQKLTDERDKETPDQIWLLEHDPVYTQGQNGKAEHIYNPGAIPVIQVDRGGQITYHGPGQLVAYILIDLRRLKIGVRNLVTAIENATIAFLKQHDITAKARPDAPGVYVDDKKIASLGLRVRRGCSYHGLSFNINMDLAPFKGINPCGLDNITMTQLVDYTATVQVDDMQDQWVQCFKSRLYSNST